MTDTTFISTSVLGVAALLVIGGMLLVWRHNVVVDVEGNVVTTETDLPLIGKIKTATPALAIVACGMLITMHTVEAHSMSLKSCDEANVVAALTEFHAQGPKGYNVLPAVLTGLAGDTGGTSWCLVHGNAAPIAADSLSYHAQWEGQ